MVRNRRDEGSDHFDLLPLIAILMCTLGCLLFVTLGIAAISLGRERSEGWVPIKDKSQASQKTPVLVEWDGVNVVIHPLNGVVQHGRFSIPDETASYQDLLAGPKADAPLSDFLAWMTDHRSTCYALVAIRPSGFKNMGRFLNEFTSRSVDVGYEPIDQTRGIRLMKGG